MLEKIVNATMLSCYNVQKSILNKEIPFDVAMSYEEYQKLIIERTKLILNKKEK